MAKKTAPPERRARRFVDEYFVAEELGLSVYTLRHWRQLGRGPRFRKFGACVRYDVNDLEAYAAQQ
jgi:helix-turn-helix protein